jgi:hypothetical protein
MPGRTNLLVLHGDLEEVDLGPLAAVLRGLFLGSEVAATTSR